MFFCFSMRACHWLMIHAAFGDILLYLIQNASFSQNRAVLNKARDYSSRNMLTELQELHKAEVCS